MSEGPVWDKEKGEIRIFGRRDTAVNAQALCDYLDTLVGAQVAAVIMRNLEFRLGKEDASALRKEQPNLSLEEFVHLLIKWDSMAGMGVTKVTLPRDSVSPIFLEFTNPSVKGDVGAANSFLTSWWTGALTFLLGKELEAKSIVYDRENDVMKCEIAPRASK